MPSHKGAAVESQGKVLLAALGERVGGDRVRVTTEDGRAFDYPEARILWTARRLRAEGGSKREVAAALAVLRAGAGPAPDWEALRGAVPTRVPLDPTDAVRARADEAGGPPARPLPADALPPLSRRGIPRSFPKKVLAAAAAAAEAPDPAAGAREDLRSLAAFAVDDPGTFEVDDALSLGRGPGGEPRLFVHISDAAAAIAPGSPLDLQARRRAATVYLPETKGPLLPPGLIQAP